MDSVHPLFERVAHVCSLWKSAANRDCFKWEQHLEVGSGGVAVGISTGKPDVGTRRIGSLLFVQFARGEADELSDLGVNKTSLNTRADGRGDRSNKERCLSMRVMSPKKKKKKRVDRRQCERLFQPSADRNLLLTLAQC